MRSILIPTFCFVFIIPANVVAQNWSPLGAGANDDVSILYHDTVNNLLYIGGRFMYLDTVKVNGIGMWNGKTFEPLYVAELFYEYDGNAGTAIMKLQGDTWSDVGGSFDLGFGNPIVSSMMVWDDKLYVFGIFNYVGGGVRADNIAIWDGEHWYGLDAVFQNGVSSGAVYNGHLIVGGGFDSINHQAFQALAQWECEDLDPSFYTTASQEREENDDNIFSFYPNPAGSSLSITCQNINEPATLIARNIIGQPVWQSTVSPSGGEVKEGVDVSAWPPGVYFFTLAAGGQVWSEKVVVY